MGERILSLKQLIGIPGLTYSFTADANNAFRLRIPPWYSTDILGPFTRNKTVSIPGYIARSFAYVKGSTDVHVYVHGSDKNKLTLTQSVADHPFGVVFDPYEDSGQIRVTGTIGKTLHARLPAYQSQVRIPTVTASHFRPTPNGGARSFFNLAVDADDGNATEVFTCAGDDAYACMYIGPPLLYNDQYVFEDVQPTSLNIGEEAS